MGTPAAVLVCGAAKMRGCTWNAEQQVAKRRATCTTIQEALQAMVGRICPAPRVGVIAIARVIYLQIAKGAVCGTAAVFSSSTQQQYAGNVK